MAGPPLHGLYRLGHRAVSGDHDDLDVLIHLFKILDMVQSQFLAQTVIQQYLSLIHIEMCIRDSCMSGTQWLAENAKIITDAANGGNPAAEAFRLAAGDLG